MKQKDNIQIFQKKRANDCPLRRRKSIDYFSLQIIFAVHYFQHH